MHPRGSWIIVGLLAALAAQAAVVYRWVDADGVVHYSDQPVPGAQKIITAGKQLNGYAAPASSSTPNVQPPTATQFVLPNPGRGTFAIAATIIDQTTGEAQTTPSVTFYVHEPSLLSPQHRNP
jgi:hypothetical protein